MNHQRSPQLLRNNDQKFTRTTSIKLTSRDTVAIDGSVLLGLNNDRTEYMYATKYHVRNRGEQRKHASSLDVTSNCGCTSANQNLPLKSRVIYCIAARWSISFMHLIVLLAGVVKLIHLHHFAELHHDPQNQLASASENQEATELPSVSSTSSSHQALHLVILGYSTLETAITCLVLILLLLKSKCLFHDAKSSRQRLEYADLPGRSRGTGVKHSIYAYIAGTVIMILLCIALIVMLHFWSTNLLQHMYTVLLNNAVIIISTSINGSLHARLITSISRASIDHHKVALHEAVSFLNEVQTAVMTLPGMNRGSLMGGGGKDGHKLVHLTTRANLFLNGLAATEDLQCPDYISK